MNDFEEVISIMRNDAGRTESLERVVYNAENLLHGIILADKGGGV